MKKLIFLMLFATSLIIKAQDNFELSTLRIGPYTIFSSLESAEKIAGKKINIDRQNYQPSKINYKGEIIELNIYESYYDESSGTKLILGSMTTKSSKFRTKSGFGVGSTRQELVEAYKNLPSFRVYTGYDENGKPSKTESYFVITDNDANTELSFRMINNIVVEINVYRNDEGC